MALESHAYQWFSWYGYETVLSNDLKFDRTVPEEGGLRYQPECSLMENKLLIMIRDKAYNINTPGTSSSQAFSLSRGVSDQSFSLDGVCSAEQPGAAPKMQRTGDVEGRRVYRNKQVEQ